MTGSAIEEPVYTRPKLDQLLGQGSLAKCCETCSWGPTVARAPGSDWWPSIRRLFGYELAAA